MAATHRFNFMPYLGYIRLDKGAKKGLHSHRPKSCRCRARIPDVCNRTVVVPDIGILPEINILTRILNSAVTTFNFLLDTHISK